MITKKATYILPKLLHLKLKIHCLVDLKISMNSYVNDLIANDLRNKGILSEEEIKLLLGNNYE